MSSLEPRAPGHAEQPCATAWSPRAWRRGPCKTNGEASSPFRSTRASGRRPYAWGNAPLSCKLVGTSRLELLTPSVSRKCSSHLSYAPTQRKRRYRRGRGFRQVFFTAPATFVRPAAPCPRRARALTRGARRADNAPCPSTAHQKFRSSRHGRPRQAFPGNPRESRPRPGPSRKSSLAVQAPDAGASDPAGAGSPSCSPWPRSPGFTWNSRPKA